MAYTLTAKLTLTDSGPTYSASTSTPVTMSFDYTESYSVTTIGTTTLDIGAIMPDPKFVLIRAIAGSGTVNFGTDVTNIDSTGGWVLLSCQTGQPLDDFVITQVSSLTTEVIAYA
jgi:hypothetical protein